MTTFLDQVEPTVYEEIDIKPLISQELSYAHEGDFFEIKLFTANGQLLCDIKVNGKRLILGGRVIRGEYIIPYKRLSKNGNFTLITEGTPDWRQFGSTQHLIFIK